MHNPLDILKRETDDCTATPIFVTFKRCKRVSQSAYQHINLEEDLPNDFECYCLADEINLNNYIDLDNHEVDDEFLKTYFHEYGYKYDYCFDSMSFVYWSEEDEIESDEVCNAFWTRKEANKWCESNKHKGDYYSYSIRAIGALRDIMDHTCEREIKRSNNTTIQEVEEP